jgi:hypothetical protein
MLERLLKYLQSPTPDLLPKGNAMQGKLKKIKDNNPKRIVIFTIAAIVLTVALFFTRIFIFDKNLSTSPISLAILPFENLQKDSSLLYLSDGLPENLINRLSAFPDVKMFARSATFKLSDSSKSISSLKIC